MLLPWAESSLLPSKFPKAGCRLSSPPAHPASLELQTKPLEQASAQHGRALPPTWPGRSEGCECIYTYVVIGYIHPLVLPRCLQELRQYLSNLADQCTSENNAVDLPLVIILDNLHHVSSLGEVFNGLLNCKDHKW